MPHVATRRRRLAPPTRLDRRPREPSALCDCVPSGASEPLLRRARWRRRPMRARRSPARAAHGQRSQAVTCVRALGLPGDQLPRGSRPRRRGEWRPFAFSHPSLVIPHSIPGSINPPNTGSLPLLPRQQWPSACSSAAPACSGRARRPGAAWSSATPPRVRGQWRTPGGRGASSGTSSNSPRASRAPLRSQ